jgi:hypothetical protein
MDINTFDDPAPPTRDSSTRKGRRAAVATPQVNESVDIVDKVLESDSWKHRNNHSINSS